MLEELSPPPRPTPRTPHPIHRVPITSSDTLGKEEDSTVGSAISDSFSLTQMSAVNECDSPQLVRERMSTGTDDARGALDMFDRMTEQDRTTVSVTMYHELEKKQFDISHCWTILNGKPKWIQLVADIKADKKRNDASSSHQSIGLDDEEHDVRLMSGRSNMPKDSRQVKENKWQTTRVSHDAAATKIPSTWTCIFSVRENKK
ncbi:putative oxidoreductase [Hordeum vulgare]|nr:putative oxidoreductase [Hordeum vulgare]